MPYSPRNTRMVKSYAPIVNGLTELLGLDRIVNKPLYVQDSITKKYHLADEFYVKKHTQDKDPRGLGSNNFRHICKELWDQKVKNQRNGLGWRTDDEILNSASITDFLKD